VLKPIVAVVQLIALGLVTFTVVMLFFNKDDSSAPAATPATTANGQTAAVDGAVVYATNCAGCHGADGGGVVGPPLQGIADRLSEDEQLTIVENGQGGMPAWSGRLTPEEIQAVIDYTRTQL
jgi:mono/diheme cytochrome c family protein